MGAGASSGVPCEEEIGAELQRREMVAIATNCPLNPSEMMVQIGLCMLIY